MRTMGETLGVLHAFDGDMTGVPWNELNEKMSQVLRSFQAAARAELRIDSGSAQRAG
jgi:hypothetical protein